jgi:hypothetical protein
VEYTLTATDAATVTVTENEIEDTTIENGSSAVIGDGNQVSTVYDDATVEVGTEGGELELTGVVAKYATVSDSFNVKSVEIDVTVTITDSFNVETNVMEISGQNNANAIALINAFGDPLTGINLNVTSAASTTPTIQAPGVPASAIGNATATTTLTQLVVNGCDDITFNF